MTDCRSHNNDTDREPRLRLSVSDWHRTLASRVYDGSTSDSSQTEAARGDVNSDVNSTSASDCVDLR